MSSPRIKLTPQQSARIGKAIADPQRFAILRAIAAVDELACRDLVRQFPITQATISHHLKELASAELIHSRRDGQLAILRCRRDLCQAYVSWLSQHLALPPG